MEKEIIYVPRRITSAFICANNNLFFIYSTSYQRAAKYGQSSVVKDFDNTFGIPVRYSLCRSSGYFSDNIITLKTIILKEALEEAIIKSNGNPIIPFPRIGCGASRMAEFAINTHTWLMTEIDKIAYPNIVWQ